MADFFHLETLLASNASMATALALAKEIPKGKQEESKSDAFIVKHPIVTHDVSQRRQILQNWFGPDDWVAAKRLWAERANASWLTTALFPWPEPTGRRNATSGTEPTGSLRNATSGTALTGTGRRNATSGTGDITGRRRA